MAKNEKPVKKTGAASKAATARASKATAGGEVARIDELIAKSAKGGGVASEARTALAKLGDDVVSERLHLAVQSANAKIRGAAVEGGTATPGRRALFPLKAITGCLADVEPKVRLSALVALNRGWGPKNDPVYGPQRAKIKPLLEALLSDENKTIARQAAVVWKRLGL